MYIQNDLEKWGLVTPPLMVQDLTEEASQTQTTELQFLFLPTTS